MLLEIVIAALTLLSLVLHLDSVKAKFAKSPNKLDDKLPDAVDEAKDLAESLRK